MSGTNVKTEPDRKTIGTLREKTLHAVIKHYYEPDASKHEITVGSYVADIVTDGGIIEIQTGSFAKLRKKLAVFLQTSPVTVVYPLPKTKWLIWIDEKTGETTKKRKSPKQGGIHDAFSELYWIKDYLDDPNFRLVILLVDIEEYRYLNGWSEDKKRGSTRCDRMPVDIAEEVRFFTAEDYRQFIPYDLPVQFTTKDFKAATRIQLPASRTALNILYNLGVVKRVGKQGNLHIYERAREYGNCHKKRNTNCI